MANIATITNNIISALSGTTSQVLLGNATLTDFKLDSLTDVSVPTPGDGDVLKWNGTTLLWEASDAAGLTGTGTTNYLPKFTGASTLGNSAITDDGTTVTLVSRALSGTSSTFSSSVTANATSTFSNASGLSAIFSNGGAAGNYNSIELRGGTIGSAVNWKIEKDNTVANAFQITPSTTNGGTSYTTPSLTILNTGAATFSSSVTAGGVLSTQYASAGSTMGAFIKNSAASTLNNSADLWFGTWAGSTIAGTTNARISALNVNAVNAATDLLFYTYNGSSSGERMRIASGGNFIINNASTDNGLRFQVTGDGSFSGYVTSARFISSTSSSYTNDFLNSNIGTVSQSIGLRFGYDGSTYNKGAIYYVSRDANGRGNMQFALEPNTGGGNVSTANAVMTLTYEGSVGLGVTPSAWASGYKAFQVLNLSLFGTSSLDLNLSSNVYYDGTTYKYIANGFATLYNQYLGKHYWSTAVSGSANAAITFTQAMTLTANGRLLLGTTSEGTELLQVAGDTLIASSTPLLKLIASVNSQFHGIEFRQGAGFDAFIKQLPTTGELRISSGRNSSWGGFITLYTDTTEKVRITSTGAATFSSSVTASSLVKSGGTSTQYLMADGSTSTLTSPVTGTGTTNYLPKFTGASTLGNSTIFDNGSAVGIGTAVPLGIFEVSGTGVSYFTRQTKSILLNPNVVGANTNALIEVTSGMALGFGTGGGEKMRLDASGNLGLGVTPSATTTYKNIQNGFAVMMGSTADYGAYWNANALWNSGWKYIGTAAAFRYEQGAGHAWFNAPSGTAGNAITFTQAMTLTANGRLLLGTTSEGTQTLQVTGASLLTTSAAGSLTAKIRNEVTSASGNTGYGLVIESEASGASSYALTIRNLAESQTYFHVSTATGIVGNVGIGLITPQAKLVVLNSSGTAIPSLGSHGGHLQLQNGTFGLLSGVTTGGNAWMQVQRTDGTATAYNLILQPTAGSVAIGSASSSSAIPLYINVASGNNTNLAFQQNSTDKWYIRNITGTDDFSFYSVVGALEAMRLTTAGAATFSSSVTAASFIPTSSTAPANGIYLPAANSVAISTNSTNRLSVSSLGVVTVANLAGSGTAIVVTDNAGNLSTQPTSTYLTSLTGEATSSGGGATTVTLTNSAVIGKVLTGLNVYSASIAATDSILAAFGKIQGQIDGLQGGTIYKGSWNANTNTPAITSGTGTQGNYYVVTTAGTTTIDGVSSWAVGDWIIFNGTIWEKIPNVDAITSVNGQTGVVSLTTANISEVTNLYYTDTRARAAISLTTSGSNGASTYSSGVFNIPTYTLAGLGGAAAATTITINGTAQDLSASRTFSVGTVTSVSGTGTVSGLTLTGSITNSGSLTLGGTLTLTSGNVTTALGFTPYNSTNPAGYTTNTGTVTSIVAGTYLTGGTITTSGTIAVDATTTNTADKIVARDASGNFSAGIITAVGVNSSNFYDGAGNYNVNLGSGGSEGRGVVAGYSGTAYSGIGYNVRHGSSVTYIAPLSDTSSYLSFASGGFIFYGAPSGSVGRTLSYNTLGSFSGAGTFNAVNITVNGNQTLHAANWNSYAPSLTGTGASGSWGISVTGNAATVGGLSVHTDRNNEVNKIVRTDANGYIQAGWINTTSGDNGTTAIDRIYASSDAYLRYYTPANFRTVLDVPTRTGGSASGTWAISVTGNAATATSLTSSNFISRSGSSGNYNTDFQNTPAGSVRHLGDDSTITNNPGGAWWFIDNYRHSNASNYWGTQVAWGWEDNANRLATRNIQNGTFGGWTYYLNSGNYNSYAPTLTGTGASGTWAINITGSAAVASISSQVTINYNNNTDSSYQMLWGAGNSVYGTAGITCNPFTDTVNLTGTLNSAGLGVVGFGRMYGGDFWHSGTANNGTRTPTLKLGRFSDSETPAYIVYTNDTDTDTLEFFSERYAGDFRLTRNSETGLRNMMRVNSDNNGTVLDLYTGGGSTLGVKLQSDGDARFAYDVVAYYSFSDARLKKNVATIENPLQKVMAMRGVSYEWNEGYKIGKKEIGLIAQEVMEIIPEVVAEKERVDGSKFLSVDYEHLTGLLIEAVKELKREVDELKSK